MNKTTRLIYGLTTSIIFSLSACQIPTQTAQQPLAQKTAKSYSPYYGPVDLSINTGLSTQKTGTVISLTEPSGGFSVKSDASDIVFQKTFQQIEKKDVFLESLSIKDPSQHYILEVEKHAKKAKHGLVQVNINGTNWVKEKDFENKQTFVISNDSVTLQAVNSLRVKVSGNKNLSVTVTLKKGGESNVILRRRGKLERKKVTQAIHEKRNDQNVFDPNNPNSLGLLDPYEGDIKDDNNTVIGFSRSGEDIAEIIVGKLTAVISEPIDANIAQLVANFPVRVVDKNIFEGDTFVDLEVVLDQVKLDSLVGDLVEMNTRGDRESLREASFSSINTARTVATAANIYLNAKALIKDISLNGKVEKHQSVQIVDTQEQSLALPLNSFPAGADTPPSSIRASNLWWLETTRIKNAFSYSTGAGSTVSIIDSNFGNLYKNEEFGKIDKSVSSDPPYTNQQFEDKRIITSKDPVTGISHSLEENYFLNQTLKACASGISCNDSREIPGHGLGVMSLLSAGLNDNTGIVGAAPESELLPIYTGGSDLAVRNALSKLSIFTDQNPGKVDVVNISIGTNISFFDSYFASLAYLSEELSEQTQEPDIKRMLRDSSNSLIKQLKNLNPNHKKTIQLITKMTLRNKVIFVASGGNDGNFVPESDLFTGALSNFPSSLPWVISVGAYNKSLERAMFTTLSGSSAFGSLIDIWAPGNNLYVRSYKNSVRSESDIPDWLWNYHEGTSHATPLVAGTVALIKSLKPELKTAEIMQILQESAFSAPDPTSFRVFGETNSVYLLNAEGAMKHPLVNAKEAQKYKFRVEDGGFLLDIEKRVPVESPILVNPPSVLYTNFFESTLADYPDLAAGDFIEVTGWTHTEQDRVPFGQIKALSLKEITEDEAGFSTLSAIDETAPEDIPDEAMDWLVRDSKKIYMNPGDVIGVGIEAEDLSQVEIQIDGHIMDLKTITDDYVTFEVGQDLTPGVKDIIIKLAGGNVTLEQAIEIFSLPRFQETQSFATGRNQDVNAFKIDNNTFTAYANAFPSNGTTGYVDLRKWNGQQMAPFQQIPAETPYHTEFFEIEGQKFLAVAEYREQTGPQQYNYDIPSRLYKWNGTQFEPFQSFDTRGAHDIEYFKTNNTHYLWVANRFRHGGDYSFVNSALYKWNGTQFENVTGLRTYGAKDWNYIRLNNENFFALSYAQNSGGGSFRALMYNWEGEGFSFVPAGFVEGEGISSTESFSINGENYLATTSTPLYQYTSTIPSRLFKWNVGLRKFEPIQSFTSDTSSYLHVENWRHFNYQNRHYLMMAGHDGSGNKSNLYRWNGTQFVLQQSIVTTESFAWDFIDVQEKFLGFMANRSYGPVDGGSKVYRFE